MNEFKLVVEKVIETAYQDGAGLALGRQDYRPRQPELVAHIMKAAERIAGETEPGDHTELFKTLCEVLGHGRIKYTPMRAKKLRARLKTFSADEIIQAAQAIADNPFMMGENPNNKRYGTVDYLLKNDEKLDEWLDSANGNGNVDLTTIDF